MSAKPVIIDLLRHGEVEGPVSVARGCGTDVPLTGTGWQQLRTVGEALRAEGSLTAIATSPLSRCAGFADELGVSLQLPVMRLDAMREIDFGDWEGKQGHEISDQTLLSRFMENPSGIGIPGGESAEALSARVIDCWQSWLDGASGEHRLLVAHGMVIRVLLAHLLGQPLSHLWRLALPYAAWCRVSLLAGEQPRILFINRATSDHA